jgi:single-strand DNA-binding protein
MNKVILIGRLTRNADIRWSQGQDQKAIARFTVAVDRKVAKNNDPNQQTADFVSCVAFGKTAEFLEKYGTQGTKFAIEGRIQTGSYTNKDNQKVYTTDVVVESLEFAESKRSQEQSGQNRGNVDPDGFMNIPDGVEAEGLPFN